MSQTLNMFDLTFLIVTLIFIVFAFFRGFVKEIFSLINWILATFLVFLVSPFVAKLINYYAHNMVVSNIISSSVCFIVIFIATSLMMKRFSYPLSKKIPGGTDQILGLVYGFLKSFLVFGFVYAVSVNLHIGIYGVARNASLKERMPSWLYQSKFRKALAPFGQSLDPVAKILLRQSQEQFLGEEIVKNHSEKQKNDQKKQKKAKKLEKLKKTDEKYKETGYSKRQIQKMDRLIEIIE